MRGSRSRSSTGIEEGGRDAAQAARRMIRQATGLGLGLGARAGEIAASRRAAAAKKNPSWITRQPAFVAAMGGDAIDDDGWGGPGDATSYAGGDGDKFDDDSPKDPYGFKRRKRRAAADGDGGGVESLGYVPSVSCRDESVELLRMLALAVVIAAPGILWAALNGGISNSHCDIIEGVCVWQWATFAGAAVVMLALLRLMIKLIARTCMRSRFIVSNHAFLFLRVHPRLATLLWAVFLYCYWFYVISPRITTDVGEVTKTAIRKTLGCYVAYAVLWLVKDLIVLEIAQGYLWTPYYERVQDSILAQYLLLIVNDFALGGRRDREDQDFALAMAERAEEGANISLFAISRAIAFIPNKLKMYTDSDDGTGTVIDSAKAARRYGHLLFDALIAAADRAAAEAAAAAATTARPLAPGSEEAVAAAVLEDRAWPLQRTLPMGTVREAGRLLSVKEDKSVSGSGSRKDPTGDAVGYAGVGAYSGAVNGLGGGHGGNANANGAAATNGAPLANGMIGSTFIGGNSGAAIGGLGGGAGSAGVSGNGNGNGNGMRSRDGSLVSNGPREVLTLWTLRPAMHRKLAQRLIEVLSQSAASGAEVLHKDEFAEGVVAIYRQRKSLTLTLQDYEAIVHKLGRVIACGLAVLLMFVVLWIWSTQPLQLGVTLVTVAVAFSFVFGSTASEFCDSCVFVFVTRAYDVGDRIFFVDDSNVEQNYTVSRINMLTTIFKRFDDMNVCYPNKKLAGKEIKNQRRSGPGFHKFELHMRASTPPERITALRDGLRAFAVENAGVGLFSVRPESIAVCRAAVRDGNRLVANLVFTQRGSFQDNSTRFYNQDVMVAETVRLCAELGIDYQMPLQPISVTSSGHVQDTSATGAFVRNQAAT